MLKKLIVLIILFAGLMGATWQTASAAPTTPKIYIDGNILSLSNKPIVKNGTTLVPVRQIAEKLGLTVVYEGKTNTITFKNPYHSTNITHKIGTNKVNMGSKSRTLLQNSVAINGVTYVPIRLFEAFDAKVFWEASTNNIYVSSYELWQNQLLILANLSYENLYSVPQGKKLKDINFNNLPKIKADFERVQKKLYIYNSDGKGNISVDRFLKEYYQMGDWEFLTYLTKSDFTNTKEYDKMKKTGFDGFAFRNLKTKEVVIAYRGSEQPSDFLSASKGTVIANSQKPYALKLFTKVYSKYNKPVVYLVGHSLGGNLTQAVTQYYPKNVKQGYTYNAFGIGTPSSTKQVVNYRIVEDKVESLRSHFGRSVYYNVRPYPNSLFAMESHSIFNFYGHFFAPKTKYWGYAVPYNNGKPNYEWTY